MRKRRSWLQQDGYEREQSSHGRKSRPECNETIAN